MNRALFAAASGMAAQQTNLDVIANNLANADVAGFKGATASFGEIAVPGRLGLGTASLGTQTVFEQGKLMKSGGPFDVAIDGSGFFTVTDAHGRRAFTRDGEFSRAPDGTLRNAKGWKLEGVRIPEEASSVNVDEGGNVAAQTARGKKYCGRIGLANFPAPEHLESLGGSLFSQTREAGKVQRLRAGANDMPKIRFGMLEQSNVSIVQAMMQILEAQRAYEANAKGVQASDEMMRIANNLNRG
ncbi:MAG: flagellar hook-basal body complex protein [Candidatus Eremiobacteraeota bacterium]|nr:flagellar hook-basal body complex protein [Candidatus Eremiobacteraeota bacterium]